MNRAVVVAHRDTMVAEGIAAALNAYPGIISIGVATTAEDGERWGQNADAMAIDRRLPGAEVAAARLQRKGVRVVWLGESAVNGDGVAVSLRAKIASLASALVPDAPTHPATIGCLTARERQVLSLAALGLAAKQIAKQLGISAKTVERHKTKIFAKLGVPNQTAAVSLALSNGLRVGDAWNGSGI
jgi:DNA-binding NarL/FixJ family response regulator